MRTFPLFPALFAAMLVPALASGQIKASWRYYRVGNTGIQGDYCEAVYVSPDGDPYIGGYDPSFEEGGFSKFLQAENRWLNYSNVDYRVIGHPNDTGVTRVSDIVPDSNGKLWMGTWRGVLTFDPSVGASSLARFGPQNSTITDDRVGDIDRAPDGTMWFANNGVSRYNPQTKAWTHWASGNSLLAVQPKSTGGYLVWSSTRPPYQDYTFVFDSTTQQWTTIDVTYPNGKKGDVAGMPGKDCVDDAGNFWALRLENPGDYDSLDYRRSDGTWVTPPEPYLGATFSIEAFKAYGNGKALLVDGSGQVFQFNGLSWSSLGVWRQGGFTSSVDVDALGNVWVCGIGGAAKRSVATGLWQRYRITNTGNFDDFNSDLTLDPTGVYAGANAGSGVGGMVHFDGLRWTGWDQLTYGLGHDWPFPNDNCETLTYRPSSGRVAVSPLNWLYGIHEWDGTGFTQLPPLTGAQKMVEDSLGRLWALGEYYSLSLHDGTGWHSPVPIIGWGEMLVKDPSRPGTVWALTGHNVVRTDGVYAFSREIGDFPELTTQSDTFTGIAVGKDGIVWIGCTVMLGAGGNGGGLIRLDANTGAYTIMTFDTGWPIPGKYITPMAVSPDGKVWIVYNNTYQSFDGGLCWLDGSRAGAFPGPVDGQPQWGGLPHTQIKDMEVRAVPGGYELWMSCLSRGIAVLNVRTPQLVQPKPRR